MAKYITRGSWAVWLMLFMGIVPLGLLVYGNNVWHQALNSQSQRMAKISQAQLYMVAAQTWSKDLLAGDMTIEVDDLWHIYDRAEGLIDSAIKFDEGVGSGSWSSDEALHQALDQLKGSLSQLRLLAKQEWQQHLQGRLNEKFSAEQRSTFSSALLNADTVNKRLNELVLETASRQRVINQYILVFWLGSILVACVLLIIFRKKSDKTEQLLVTEQHRSEATMKSISDAVIIGDEEARISYLNPVAEQLLGWSLKEALGQGIPEVFKVKQAVTNVDLGGLISRCMGGAKSIGLPQPTHLMRRTGADIMVHGSMDPLRINDGNVTGIILVFQDISNVQEMVSQLSYYTSHDPLTGLVNRTEFEARLEQLTTTVKWHDRHHALCYIDLDRFRVINETCGHAAGDQLLQQLAGVLLEKVRDTDTLARLGGDEFALLLVDCSLKSAYDVAEKLITVINEFRFDWKDQEYEITASIGVVPITTDEIEGTAGVMGLADTACYMAKEEGRNRAYLAESSDEGLQDRQGQLLWVTRINQAIANDRFCLFRQDIIATKSDGNSEKHYELLIRLIDDQGEIVPPMVFIPVAERYNLASSIDRWVIKTALTKYKSRFLDQGGKALESWSINISGASLGEAGFTEFIKEQFNTLQVPPEKICFEITETAAISNMAAAVVFIKEIKAMGCRFALDDFGSGLSSFTYLKKLPVDFLKIDGSFVKDMLNDPIDCAMVESINHIGHVLGIKTVAEFVENEEILKKVTELGVDFAQGYGIAKPHPL